MDIKSNVKEFQSLEKKHKIKVVAVSKTKPVEIIMEAYKAGLKTLGENKVQELTGKHESLPKDIEWHMIGHLQRNKVKYLVPFVHLIHSVDSARLIKEINKQARKNSVTLDCLLQVHIAREESKFGFSEDEIYELINSASFREYENINVKGLMGMATFTEDEKQIRQEFRYLRGLFEKIGIEYNLPNLEMKELSMGMSNDYHIAIEEGSTMIRVGSAIFGSRN